MCVCTSVFLARPVRLSYYMPILSLLQKKLCKLLLAPNAQEKYRIKKVAFDRLTVWFAYKI